MKSIDNKVIRVEGHTDNVKIRYRLKKTFQTNWELSATRATNVVRFLIDKVGVDPKKIYAVGMSKYHPIGDNNNSHGRSLNRRIEIMLEAVEKVQEVRELQLVDQSAVDTQYANIEDATYQDEVTIPVDVNSHQNHVVRNTDASSEFSDLDEPNFVIDSQVPTSGVGLGVITKIDSGKTTKIPSYSSDRSQSGVGYIWVKKRITDFSSE